MSAAIGKTRNPVGVWLLTLVTFGIYGLYWWYKINDEVGEFDESIDVNPVLSLLAMLVPIANLVSLVRTGGRIGQAQQNAQGRAECSGWLGLLLGFVFGLYIVYYQANLNKLWAQSGAPAEY